CSGEALSVDLQNQFFQHLNIPLHNLYGPTEAAVDVSHWTCRQTSMQVCVPIGRPISNVKLYVLDQCMNPVPVGVPGELYIGGIALAREYLGNETLTAKSFIEHEVVENCPERLYKTGDLVKYLNDGNIEYLGRLDYQVKLRGLRIELGEIESCIKHSQDIDDCVVLLQGEDVEQRIVAYIVHNATELDVEHLKIGLKSSLPDYMIPSAFMVLPSIPVTANGKVDRKELLKIKVELSHQQEFVPPRNETEEILATLWGEVLRLDAIGVKDNFFDLGGHSLLATQVISRVKETFQVELSLSVLFENQTIENMAIHILEQEAKSVDMDIMAELLAELEDLDGADLEGILDDG
ncbi:MAG: AMP-binding protein, partial [Gammaproteobacteria bacterium]|nr:AMP-binding protein [Gammaproteobacteria bacterium]